MHRPTRLRYWRLKRFLTQEKLAERTELTEATISRIESGTPPRISTALKLADALQIAPEELYTTEDDPDADGHPANRENVA